MLRKLRYYLHEFRQTSFGDKLQFFGLLATVISLWFVVVQLQESTKTNKVSIRGQLYETEGSVAADEASEDSSNLSSVWAIPPADLEKQALASFLVSLGTEDATAIAAKNADELYRSIYDAAAFAKDRREKTKQLRKIFLFVQTNFYHVHNAFDYQADKVLTKEEWETWKGIIREMHGHPMLLAVIAQGHRYRYYSQGFARFLQAELCSPTVPPDVEDPAEYRRAREFIRYYYPQMFESKWVDVLPRY